MKRQNESNIAEKISKNPKCSATNHQTKSQGAIVAGFPKEKTRQQPPADQQVLRDGILDHQHGNKGESSVLQRKNGIHASKVL
ncbi:MAG: hypothetical protein IPL65_06800 [Lewinellaceae bacterium]|nr:hypothetical protein [Lewinellaceae bacterium]